MNHLDRIYTQDPARFATAYFDYLGKVLQSIDCQQITHFIRTLLDARERMVTLFFIGNGGSATTASHFANDLGLGTRCLDKPFRAISLTDNQALITAIGNDFGYEEIFVQQLRLLGKPGDVLIGISASGNSQNILNAFAHAKANGIKTVALTAFDGGKMRAVADESIHVPTEAKEYGPAEDAHMILDHLVTAYLMRAVTTAV